MTKVKMLTRFATPSIMAGPGQIIDLPDGVADSLIINGYAVLIEHTIETATLDRAVETEARPAPKKKKR